MRVSVPSMELRPAQVEWQPQAGPKSRDSRPLLSLPSQAARTPWDASDDRAAGLPPERPGRRLHGGWRSKEDRATGPAGGRIGRASDAGCKTSLDVVSEDGERFARCVLPALPHVDYCILNEFNHPASLLDSTRRFVPSPPGRLRLIEIKSAHLGNNYSR